MSKTYIDLVSDDETDSKELPRKIKRESSFNKLIESVEKVKQTEQDKRAEQAEQAELDKILQQIKQAEQDELDKIVQQIEQAEQNERRKRKRRLSSEDNDEQKKRKKKKSHLSHSSKKYCDVHDNVYLKVLDMDYTEKTLDLADGLLVEIYKEITREMREDQYPLAVQVFNTQMQPISHKAVDDTFVNLNRKKIILMKVKELPVEIKIKNGETVYSFSKPKPDSENKDKIKKKENIKTLSDQDSGKVTFDFLANDWEKIQSVFKKYVSDPVKGLFSESPELVYLREKILPMFETNTLAQELITELNKIIFNLSVEINKILCVEIPKMMSGMENGEEAAKMKIIDSILHQLIKAKKISITMKKYIGMSRKTSKIIKLSTLDDVNFTLLSKHLH